MNKGQLLHLALQGLLRELPSPGPWDKEDKKRFIEAFKNTLDLLYPDNPHLEDKKETK